MCAEPSQNKRPLTLPVAATRNKEHTAPGGVYLLCPLHIHPQEPKAVIWLTVACNDTPAFIDFNIKQASLPGLLDNNLAPVLTRLASPRARHNTSRALRQSHGKPRTRSSAGTRFLLPLLLSASRPSDRAFNQSAETQQASNQSHSLTYCTYSSIVGRTQDFSR